MTGKITRVVPDKGFGFITGEDGQDYFFHQSALTDARPNELVEGAAVTFDPVKGPKGLRAEVVRITRH